MPVSATFETIRDWVGLSFVHGVGCALFARLIKRYGSPTEVLNGAGAVRKELGSLRPGYLEELTKTEELRRRAERELEELAKIGGRALILDDPDYPRQLRHTTLPPPVLYLRGSGTLPGTDSVAIVGSRAATSYGRRVCRAMARELASFGVCVVSGLALGIDAEAHTGALEGLGSTVGVLGCGLDVVYPRTNRHLYERIAATGLLISEYPLATPPEGYHFPARNRIIAGLSKGIVVVEASKKSGSLITVQFALEEGREIFAVPGQVDSLKSAGTHWLVQQGASLAVSAADIVSQLAIEYGDERRRPRGHSGSRPLLDPELEELLSIIEPYPQSRETLFQHSGYSAARFNEALLLLELEGLVAAAPGDMIYRSTGSGG